MRSRRWQWYWWLYDENWFQMLVAQSLCWRLISLCWWFSQGIKSVTNILNRSPTSQTCHHHFWSPTSVTNIDLTDSESLIEISILTTKNLHKKKLGESVPSQHCWHNHFWWKYTVFVGPIYMVFVPTLIETMNQFI